MDRPLIGSSSDQIVDLDNDYGSLDFDNEFLASMGYKQELKREYSTFEVFGISFSIMGLLPSISSTLSIGLTGGPMSLVWGWAVSGVFLVAIGAGMSELASSLPTSGGLYFWTYHFAPVKMKVPLSFFIGITNSMALIGGLCSITYGLAGQVLACINIFVPDFGVTGGLTFSVFSICIIMQTLLTCISSAAVARLQAVSIWINTSLILLFLVLVPWGTSRNHGFNSWEYALFHFENSSDWPNWWCFLQFGLMPGVWTISSFDSCVHMSEEAKNPSRAVPIGILGSISLCWIMGLVINIVICLCMKPDVGRLLASPMGEPMAQILVDSLGIPLAIGFMVLIIIGQFLMGSSTLVAISRQVWAFARDDGMPFADYIKVVDVKLATPIRAVVISSMSALAMGLITLVGSTAANALFSLSVMGNYISWVVPQLLRFLGNDTSFQPGKFYMGPFWSPIVNWVSICFQGLIFVTCCFPEYMEVTKETMNYAIVVNVAAWGLSMWYFYTYKIHTYTGPKANVQVEVLDGLEPETEGAAPPVKMTDSMILE